jgi:hypothetical protein
MDQVKRKAVSLLTAEIVAMLTVMSAVATASALSTGISTNVAISAVSPEVLGHGTSN